MVDAVALTLCTLAVLGLAIYWQITMDRAVAAREDLETPAAHSDDDVMTDDPARAATPPANAGARRYEPPRKHEP